MSIGGKEFTFNFDDDPPSLRLDLIIASPDPLSSEKFEIKNVLIDTGSDRTLIPNDIIKALKLRWTGEEITVTGFNDSNEMEIKFYSAKVIIAGIEEVLLPVGGVDFTPLIGRDLLNRWHILINAPFSTFEIANPINYTGGKPTI